MREEVLVATLGTQPQVVTLVLDELLRRGHRIGRVVVIHTDDSRGAVREAVFKLRAEADRHYARLERPVSFEFVPIEDERGGRPADILTEEDSGAAFSTIYRAVLREKREGRRVHLSIAGGRKVMSVYGMTVAQILFDEGDSVWHLVSEDALQEGRRLHVGEDERVELVPVPVLRWSSISPALTELVRAEDPWAAIRKQREMAEERERRELLHFIEGELSEAEREVLRLAVQGLTNREIARRVFKSEGRVRNVLTRVYRKYREFRGLRGDVRVDRRRLISDFSRIFGGR